MEHHRIDPIDEALGRLAEADAHRRQAEVDKVRALLDLADTWDVDETTATLVIANHDMPKHLRALERRLEGGADGTTQVGEFLALEIGPILGVTPTTAASLLADALNLRDRHPALWDAVQDGHLDVWQARRVTRATSHLPHAAADWVDRQLALTAQLMPWPRILNQLPGLIMKAEPALAAERARQASAARYVRFGQITDGHIDLWARLDAGDALTLHAALNHTAGALISARKDACAADPTLEPLFTEEARAIALGLLARSNATAAPAHTDTSPPSIASVPLLLTARQHLPWQPLDDPAAGREPVTFPPTAGTRAPATRESMPPAPRPHATLVVHICDTSLARGDGAVRVEGWGPELVERLPQLLAGCKVTVRPIIDPAAMIAADSYEIPEQHRWAVCVRNPVDTFPYGTRTARSCDLDHTIPYPTGPTSIDNLAPLSRRPHRAKTLGLWRVKQVESGHLEWASPHGRRYLVTPTGTRRLDAASGRDMGGARRRAARELTPKSAAAYRREIRSRLPARPASIVDYARPPIGIAITTTGFKHRQTA